MLSTYQYWYTCESFKSLELKKKVKLRELPYLLEQKVKIKKSI